MKPTSDDAEGYRCAFLAAAGTGYLIADQVEVHRHRGIPVATVLGLGQAGLGVVPGLGELLLSFVLGGEKTYALFGSLDVGVNLRYNIASRNKVDLAVLGGIGIDVTNTTTDPDGNNNDITDKTTTLGVAWGLGAEYHINGHWAISVDGLNPLAAIANGSSEDDAASTETKTQGSIIGVGWDPTIRIMGHLYL